MIKSYTSKVTPFGGIHLIHKRLSSEGVFQFIDNELGSRVSTVGFRYSDIFLSRIYTAFCGGNATEDINYIRENTLQPLKGITIPSPDTILRGDLELATQCTFLETGSGKENKININPVMNKFLVRSAVKFKQINPGDTNLVYDFDHQFVPAEK
jgi:hypothetical protein